MNRTIVIGLDSADLKLTEDWIGQGELPCLAGLFATCPLVSLSTPSRAMQGSVWPSLLTGVSPGRHGMYLYTQLRNGTYKLANTRTDHVQQTYFYQYLNEAGFRCGLADIPGDRPASGLNGIQVVDWSTEFHYWGYTTLPRRFALDLRWRIGRNPMTRHYNSGDSQGEHRHLCDKLAESIRLKTSLGKHLLERSDLDLVAFVFGESHKAGHWLWKYHDEAYPGHEPCDPDLREGLLNVYRQIDHALGELLEGVGPEDNLIVFSDHGMQAAYRGDHLIDLILQQLGLLELKPGASLEKDKVHPQSRPLAQRLYVAARATAKRMLSPGLMRALERSADSYPDVNWARTRAFSLPTDRNSYVRLNLAGREPSGVVRAADYQAELDALEVALRALINPRTGRPAVAEIFQIRRDFPGERQNDLPDMAIRWSAEAPIEAVTSPTLGRISRPFRELRSGNHREEGFLLGRGPAFREEPGRYNGDILQIAPTILHLHGIPAPAHFEMLPFSQILR